jgi:hypothetical protein
LPEELLLDLLRMGTVVTVPISSKNESMPSDISARPVVAVPPVMMPIVRCICPIAPVIASNVGPDNNRGGIVVGRVVVAAIVVRAISRIIPVSRWNIAAGTDAEAETEGNIAPAGLGSASKSKSRDEDKTHNRPEFVFHDLPP